MARNIPKHFDFKPEGDAALSRKPVSVKVPVEVEAALKLLPASERGKWLRKVITEAVRNELLREKVA